MSKAKKLFYKTTLMMDSISYFVLLPLAIYVLFYHGKLYTYLRYSLVALILVVLITLIHGFIFRYIHLYKPLKKLYDNENKVINYHQIKVQLLNFPRKEAYSSSTKWIYGAFFITGYTNLFIPFSAELFLIALAAVAQSLLINFMNNYYISERLISEVLIEPELSREIVNADEYRQFGLIKKMIVTYIGLTLMIFIATSFLWEGALSNDISNEYFPYHLSFTIVSIIIILFVTIYLNSYATKRNIERITHSIEKMSKGELSSDLSMISIDELGILSTNLYKFILSLNNITNLIYSEVENIYKHSNTFNFEVLPSNKEKMENILDRSEFNNIFEVGEALHQISIFLTEIINFINRERYIKDGQVSLNDITQRFTNHTILSDEIVKTTASHVDASVGVLYNLNDEVFKIAGSFAYHFKDSNPIQYHLGEGLIGQIAKEKEIKIIKGLPDDESLYIDLGLMKVKPKTIALIPCVNNEQTDAVMVLGSMKVFTKEHLDYFDSIQHSVALSIHSNLINEKNRILLKQSQELTQELQQQHEELLETNAEMEQINEELEQQTNELKKSEALQEEQKLSLIDANEELKKVQEELEIKADKLEKTNKYKSEFLANMSHELRTPLNSIIILSKMLFNNRNNTLSEKEIEYSETIFKAANDLLDLINEVLSLSKVEAGMMELNIESINIHDLIKEIKKGFEEIAISKGISFSSNIDQNVPQFMNTDEQRLKQIIKNLLSNAFKFTEEGSIDIQVSKENSLIKFLVKDTGIGINQEEQEIIFQEFRQADGNINRKYGGTGLGLSISQKYAKLLGGSIRVDSKVNDGSTFSLFIPENSEEKSLETKSINHDHQLLIIANKDNDKELVDIIKSLSIPYITVTDYNSAQDILNSHTINAIIIDYNNNMKTLVNFLDKLKSFNITKMIYSDELILPNDEDNLKKYVDSVILKRGNSQKRLINELNLFMNKKAKKPMKEEKTTIYKNNNELLKNKKILIVDDDMRNVFALTSVLEDYRANVIVGKNGKEGIKKLKENENVDLILMDIMMPEMDGFETIKVIREDSKYNQIPIITLTAKAMKDDRRKCLETGANDYISKPVDVDKLLSLIKVWIQK